MTIQDLIERLRYYHPQAEVKFAVGPNKDAELLSMYSKNEDPVKDMVVYLDVGTEEQ